MQQNEHDPAPDPALNFAPNLFAFTRRRADSEVDELRAARRVRSGGAYDAR